MPPLSYVNGLALNTKSFDAQSLKFGCTGNDVLRRSRDITAYLVLTSSTQLKRSGKNRIFVLFSKYVANDSFIHTSSHQSSVTRSPNHWCAASCVSTVTP